MRRQASIEGLLEKVFQRSEQSDADLASEVLADISKWQCDFLTPLIYEAVQRMRNDVQNFGVPRQQTDAPRGFDYVVDRIKGIGYVDSDGSTSFTTSYGFKTAFALMSEMNNNNIDRNPDLIASKLSVSIPVATFLYSVIPTVGYLATFGVTGTLATLPKAERSILEKTCNICKYTYTQSIYPRKEVFDVQPNAALFQDEREWMDRISQIVDVTRKRTGDKGFPTVVVFENAHRIKMFREHQGTDFSCRVLTPESNPITIRDIIANATLSGAVTLMTREYGRGLDFKCKLCDKLTVIQTFFTASVSEEVQIRGRTGRQGEDGIYYLQLFLGDVVRELTPKDGSAPDPAAIVKSFQDRSSSSENGAYFYKILDVERHTTMSLDLTKRTEACDQAKRADDVSWEVVDKLFSTQATREEKLEVIKRQAMSGSMKVSLTFLLDISASMGEPVSCRMILSRWDSLKQSFQALWDDMQRELNPLTTNVTIIPFDHNASVLYCDSLANLPRNELDRTGVRGATSFDAAITEATNVLSSLSAKGFRDHAVLLLTDGEDGSNPTGAVARMLQTVAVTSFYCIRFGSGATTPTQLYNALKAGGIEAKDFVATDAQGVLDGFRQFTQSNAPERGGD